MTIFHEEQCQWIEDDMFFIIGTKIQKLDFKFIVWTSLNNKTYKEGASHIFAIEEA